MQSRQHEQKRYASYIPGRHWRPIIFGIILFIGGALIEGIIGNSGNSAFQSLLSQLVKSIGTNWVPWAITLFFFLIAFALLIITLYAWANNRSLHQALNVTTNFLDLDDSLLRLLASWIPDKSQENEMKLLLPELLRDACREFGEYVYRAAILLPVPNAGGEYLKVWAYTKLSQESVDRMRFYIGNDEMVKRGVAGQAFKTKELQIAHMIQEEQWKCDHDCYISFTERKHPPAYRSFVCVPIIGPSQIPAEGIVSLGTICFDSLNPKIFDTDDTETILRAFARRIASTLLIYRLLSSVPIRKENLMQTTEKDT